MAMARSTPAQKPRGLARKTVSGCLLIPRGPCPRMTIHVAQADTARPMASARQAGRFAAAQPRVGASPPLRKACLVAGRRPPGLPAAGILVAPPPLRSEEHTSELQSLMRISYAVFCLKKKKQHNRQSHNI